MIATSRKSTFPPTISRQFEFTRLQDQLITLAYHALLPVISCRMERQQDRLQRKEQTAIQRFQSKAGGA